MKVEGQVRSVAARDVARIEPPLEDCDEPLVLRGGIDRWPALRDDGWSPAGLARRLGARPARYKASPSHKHPDFGAPSAAETFETRETTFAEYLERVSAPGPGAARCFLTGDEEYVLRRRPGRADDWNPKLEPLRSDFELPDAFPEEALYTVWLWISGAGVRSWLHYDTNGCHNLNAQVNGSKRAWLFPPAELGRLYPFELFGAIPAHNCSRVDIEAPDPGRFPAFEGARCLEAELRAGDLLFLPADWIHSFLHTGPFNVNLNFWWRPSRLRSTPVSERRAFLDHVAALGAERKLTPDVREALAALDRRLIGAERVS